MTSTQARATSAGPTGERPAVPSRVPKKAASCKWQQRSLLSDTHFHILVLSLSSFFSSFFFLFFLSLLPNLHPPTYGAYCHLRFFTLCRANALILSLLTKHNPQSYFIKNHPSLKFLVYDFFFVFFFRWCGRFKEPSVHGWDGRTSQQHARGGCT